MRSLTRSPQDAETVLRQCVREGRIIAGKHFRAELANEALDFQDALAVLQHGVVTKAPEFNVRTQEWKYTVEGLAGDHVVLKIVFAIGDTQTVFLITVFSESR